MDKSIKILASGKAKLAEREQFNYSVKINNKIMPDLDLHDLVFNPVPAEEKEKKSSETDLQINIIEIYAISCFLLCLYRQ